ncbi:chaperonin 10-like protein [Mycena rebaudengoi]|nr:chaperonin 10-like protein [Mycena rebaudengoi]
MSSPETTMKAIRWHPPSFDIRVETVPVPKIEDPDDAIVKVKLAALCGSDLHGYRGHAGLDKVHICGHEFIGEVVELGSSYGATSQGRPALYSTLKVGDKVVSPFTVNCGECNVCRMGYTCRCPVGALFGSPVLDGGQAQFVRVPKAGGTLFNLNDHKSWKSGHSDDVKSKALAGLADSSLLMLADILPTGVFAALQAMNHPKVAPALTGRPWPTNFFPGETADVAMLPEDRVPTFAVIGLGPVGLCACVSLLDMLSAQPLPFQIVVIDPNESRREKMLAVYSKINQSDGNSSTAKFVAKSIEDAKKTVDSWTGGVGCTAVLEVVGNPSAISLAYDFVRPFGAIISVGVHGEPLLPFTGRQLYNKNVSLCFGRCPARAMFPMAFDLLVKRQDVFGGVGGLGSLVDKIRSYRDFEQNKVGKVIFDMWK